MVEFMHTVKSSVGLHARPAGLISSTAKKFESKVSIYFGDAGADGKRLLSVMALGAKCGAELRFEIEGADEKEASQALKELCEESI